VTSKKADYTDDVWDMSREWTMLKWCMLYTFVLAPYGMSGAADNTGWWPWDHVLLIMATISLPYIWRELKSSGHQGQQGPG
jgi:hypothetical protein